MSGIRNGRARTKIDWIDSRRLQAVAICLLLFLVAADSLRCHLVASSEWIYWRQQQQQQPRLIISVVLNLAAAAATTTTTATTTNKLSVTATTPNTTTSTTTTPTPKLIISTHRTSLLVPQATTTTTTTTRSKVNFSRTPTKSILVPSARANLFWGSLSLSWAQFHSRGRRRTSVVVICICNERR